MAFNWFFKLEKERKTKYACYDPSLEASSFPLIYQKRKHFESFVRFFPINSIKGKQMATNILQDW